jgi:hypothetical protein
VSVDAGANNGGVDFSKLLLYLAYALLKGKTVSSLRMLRQVQATGTM